MIRKIFALSLLSTTVFSINAQLDPDNPMYRPTLYVPFREQYDNVVRKTEKKPVSTKTKNSVCVFCKDVQSNDDVKNFLMTRFEHNVVLLALFPYQRGHILIIPNAHVKNLADLHQEAREELMEIIAACSKIFEDVFNSDGTNIGINIGRAAGASKPDHVHIHAIPRFVTDKQSYIQLIAETRVVQWNMKKLYWQLKPAFDELKDKLYPRQIDDIGNYYESGQHEQEVQKVMEFVEYFKGAAQLKAAPILQGKK